jgi:(2R)-ethylmalonyl-CoA mutase
MKNQGLASIPVVAGGIIPESDAKELIAAGVKAVYTPKDYEISRILSELVDYVREAHAA